MYFFAGVIMIILQGEKFSILFICYLLAAKCSLFLYLLCFKGCYVRRISSEAHLKAAVKVDNLLGWLLLCYFRCVESHTYNIFLHLSGIDLYNSLIYYYWPCNNSIPLLYGSFLVCCG